MKLLATNSYVLALLLGILWSPTLEAAAVRLGGRGAFRLQHAVKGLSNRRASSEVEAEQAQAQAQTTMISLIRQRALEDPDTAGEQHDQPLFGVKVRVDLAGMDAKQGLSILFDKGAHALAVEPGLKNDDEALAWGHFDDNIQTTGWSELFVSASPQKGLPGDVKMYAAGFIEGLLTCVRLSQFHSNSHQLLMRDETTHHSLMNILTQFRDGVQYLRGKVNLLARHTRTEEPSDQYWRHARYLLFQLRGLCDGYNHAAIHFGVHTLSLVDLMLLNSVAEVPELIEAYSPQAMNARRGAAASFLARSSTATSSHDDREKKMGNISTEDPLDAAHWENRIARNGRCSALVRLTEGNGDLLAGHTTWADYSEMIRIWKYYDFNLPDSVAKRISMSSYPGCVSSADNYYLMDSGLLAMDTTLEILDPRALDKVEDFPKTPHLPSFMHGMIINKVSSSADDWAELYSRNNPGTYNAQWMVVDYNKFQPGQPLTDGTFYVVESIPGRVEARDMTHVLREKGYWASFNRPYFDKIRVDSGHDNAQKSHGDLYSYYGSPRGLIFAEYVPGVENLGGMRALMTNSGDVDLSSMFEPISARMDLNPSLSIPNGGIDAKVTDSCLFRQQAAQAISGPSHTSQRPFRWMADDGSELWSGYPHAGQPAVWNFDWIQITPGTSSVGTIHAAECVGHLE